MDPTMIKILAQHRPITGAYDAEADVLYLSFGEPQPAEGVDLGSGLIALYDEDTHTVVGLTLIGLAKRMARELSQAPDTTPHARAAHTSSDG